MRLVDWLDRGASMAIDRLCLVDVDRSLSYGEVVEQTWRIAQALLDHGVGPGARAAVLGVTRAGATWIPANARSTVAELTEVLMSGSCGALLFDPSMAAEAEAIA